MSGKVSGSSLNQPSFLKGKEGAKRESLSSTPNAKINPFKTLQKVGKNLPHNNSNTDNKSSQNGAKNISQIIPPKENTISTQQTANGLNNLKLKNVPHNVTTQSINLDPIHSKPNINGTNANSYRQSQSSQPASLQNGNYSSRSQTPAYVNGISQNNADSIKETLNNNTNVNTKGEDTGSDASVEDQIDEQERSEKLHNIWAKFESGQIEKSEKKKRHSTEIKELKAEILKLKMSKIHENGQNGTDAEITAVQARLDELEKARYQELEDIRNRKGGLTSLKEKFDSLVNAQEDGDSKPIPLNLEAEVTPEESEARKNKLESFKRRLEGGKDSTDSDNTKTDFKSEFEQFKTSTNLIKERILNAAKEDALPRAKSPIKIEDTDKVEYVSEPRADGLPPDLVRYGNEMNELESEVSRLRQNTAGAAQMFRKRFENIVNNEARESSPEKKDIFQEILALRQTEQAHREENNTDGGGVNDSNNNLSSTPNDMEKGLNFQIDTKNKIAKFKALENGQNINQNGHTQPRVREITPPRTSEKVVYENEPMHIDDPNYIRATSPQEKDNVISEKVNARNLTSFFESVPNSNENQRNSKEHIVVKKFTDPKINISAKTEYCYICGERLFPVDRMDFNKKPIHKNCFKCQYCGTPLRLEKYATRNEDVYCLPHFKQLFANEPGLTQNNPANLAPVR